MLSSVLHLGRPTVINNFHLDEVCGEIYFTFTTLFIIQSVPGAHFLQLSLWLTVFTVKDSSPTPHCYASPALKWVSIVDNETVSCKELFCRSRILLVDGQVETICWVYCWCYNVIEIFENKPTLGSRVTWAILIPKTEPKTPPHLPNVCFTPGRVCEQ